MRRRRRTQHHSTFFHLHPPPTSTPLRSHSSRPRTHHQVREVLDSRDTHNADPRAAEVAPLPSLGPGRRWAPARPRLEAPTDVCIQKHPCPLTHHTTRLRLRIRLRLHLRFAPCTRPPADSTPPPDCPGQHLYKPLLRRPQSGFSFPLQTHPPHQLSVNSSTLHLQQTTPRLSRQQPFDTPPTTTKWPLLRSLPCSGRRLSRRTVDVRHPHLLQCFNASSIARSSPSASDPSHPFSIVPIFISLLPHPAAESHPQPHRSHQDPESLY